MKIVNINTTNKIISRDMIIKAAIEANMQYVEMDTEILVEDILFRIKELKEINEQIFVIDKRTLENKAINLGIKSNKKVDLKRNSRLVKTKLNKNGYYKKRGK